MRLLAFVFTIVFVWTGPNFISDHKSQVLSCPRPPNRSVRLNTGIIYSECGKRKIIYLLCCPLNRGCPQHGPA